MSRAFVIQMPPLCTITLATNPPYVTRVQTGCPSMQRHTLHTSVLHLTPLPRPTCSSYRLAVQVPVLDRCLGQLAVRLRRLAAAGQPSDLWALMQDLTLAETGRIAYGWVQLGERTAAVVRWRGGRGLGSNVGSGARAHARRWWGELAWGLRCARETLYVYLHFAHSPSLLSFFPNLRVNFGTLDDCTPEGAAGGATSPASAAPAPTAAPTASGGALKTAVQQVFRTMEMDNASAYLPLQVRAQKWRSTLLARTL